MFKVLPHFALMNSAMRPEIWVVSSNGPWRSIRGRVSSSFVSDCCPVNFIDVKPRSKHVDRLRNPDAQTPRGRQRAVGRSTAVFAERITPCS